MQLVFRYEGYDVGWMDGRMMTYLSCFMTVTICVGPFLFLLWLCYDYPLFLPYFPLLLYNHLPYLGPLWLDWIV